MEPLRYPQDYEGFRYICITHEWMDNKNPCPSGDGTDRGYQEPLPGHWRIENGKVVGDHPHAERSGDA